MDEKKQIQSPGTAIPGEEGEARRRKNRAGFARNIRMLKDLAWCYRNGYSIDPELQREVFGLKDLEMR